LSTMTAPIYKTHNSRQGFPFLHTFTSTNRSFVFLIIAILTHLRWHLLMVLIFPW
jgi:hypothetical protein